MGSLFSKKEQPKQQQPKPARREPKQPQGNTDATILKMKVLQDKLLLQKKNLTKQGEKAEIAVREHVKSKNKSAAMEALKRKKLYDKQLENCSNKYMFIQEKIQTIEDKIADQQMLEVLKDANNLLNEMELASTFEQMEEVIMDLKEKEKKQQEIDNMLKQYGYSNADATVEDEYNKIEASLVTEQLQDISTDYRFVEQTNTQKLPQAQSKQNTQQSQYTKKEQDEEKEKQAMLLDEL